VANSVTESMAVESVATESVATESMARDVGDDELAASSQSKSKKDVAIFLERNDFIYNKRRPDHVIASKKNKACENLAREMEKEVKILTTFL